MKILFILGTRPEAIKLVPVIKYMKENTDLIVKVCNTEQQKEMSNDILDVFNIKADYGLDIMSDNQTLFLLTSKLLLSLEAIFNDEKPDLVIVQGDTSTAFVGSLAAFYCKIKVAHVEAGLRTYNKYSPFPEEVNRELISKMASFHFVPSKIGETNLLKENIDSSNIFQIGNTVIDSLLSMKHMIQEDHVLQTKITSRISSLGYTFSSRKVILVTGHRRENFGDSFFNIFEAIKEISLKYSNIDIVYPVHLNPNVREMAFDVLSNLDNVYLIEPLNYDEFVYLMMNSYLIITDSGGIQEEAPSLKIPTLVTRDTTERQEVLDNGSIHLVGTTKARIVDATNELLCDENIYKNFKLRIENPYGDGNASKKIFQIINKKMT